MAEIDRPDLELIERRAENWDCTTWDVQRLLRYCRELEAEVRQLREEHDKAAKRYANWLAAAGDCGP